MRYYLCKLAVLANFSLLPKSIGSIEFQRGDWYTQQLLFRFAYLIFLALILVFSNDLSSYTTQSFT